MELILVRHGLPERRHDTSDPPLAPRGVEQAHKVAAWLADEPIDAVFASTRRRAIQTAEPFAAQAGHAVIQRDGIAEYDRESIAGFQATVVAALEEIVETHPGQRVAVFCHGGVINVWTAHVLGMAPRLFFEPGYTSVHRFMCARSGQRNVLALNERAHLRDLA